MAKLAEKWTEKTLKNDDGTQLSIRVSLSDSDIIEIRSDDEEVFWLDKRDAEVLVNAIQQIAGGNDDQNTSTRSNHASSNNILVSYSVDY